MSPIRLKDLPPEKRKAIQAQKRRISAELQAGFMSYCTRAGLPTPQPEHRFARPEREWRFDWAFPEQRVALEIEGGAFSSEVGRHTRGAGFREDLRKYSEAAARGWRIVRIMPEDLYDGRTLELLRRAIRYEASS